MPEGHKTHALARDHSQLLVGQRLKISSPQGRFSEAAELVTGKPLRSVTAAGKHLFYQFTPNQIIHIHLGRYGKFRELPSPPDEPRGTVRLRMQGRNATLDLTGPTTCRLITTSQRQEVVEKLGPDPLNGASLADVWNRVRQSKQPIAAILLDQATIAGVGNIFRAEVLFETETDPRGRGNEISAAHFRKIWRSLVKMMKVGLKYGRIIAVTSKEAGKPLASVEGKDRFRVYGHSHCPRCHATLDTSTIGGRKLYWCSQCQTKS